MQVQLRSTLAGPRGNAFPGDVLDIPQAEAYAMIERGFAVQLGAPDLALAPPAPERAVARRQRGRTGGAGLIPGRRPGDAPTDDGDDGAA